MFKYHTKEPYYENLSTMKWLQTSRIAIVHEKGTHEELTSFYLLNL